MISILTFLASDLRWTPVKAAACSCAGTVALLLGAWWLS